jgi:hypothetical protein
MPRLLPIESRQARYIYFIFWQPFILSPPLSKVKTEALNLHHRWPSFMDHPTHTLHYYETPQCCLSSSRRHHTTGPCHAYFPWSQDELTISASSSVNISSRRLPSQTEIEALNPHHCCRPPSPDHPTPTFHCYKNIILTLTTLLITQSYLYFASFLARVPHYQSFTHHRHSLSSSSHTYRPSAQ